MIKNLGFRISLFLFLLLVITAFVFPALIRRSQTGVINKGRAAQ